MAKYYFTFGFGQKHEHGYYVIEAANSDEARTEMIRRFGIKWSMQYDSAEAAGVELYSLHEVEKPALMFTTQIFEGEFKVEELEAEFRTLEAACIYAMDCVKTLNTSRIEKISDSPCSVLGWVKDPEGKTIWGIESGFLTSAMDAMNAKLLQLTSEELEQIEFTIDTFLKRRGK